MAYQFSQAVSMFEQINSDLKMREQVRCKRPAKMNEREIALWMFKLETLWLATSGYSAVRSILDETGNTVGTENFLKGIWNSD